LGQFVPSQTNALGFWFATENRWLRGRIHTIHRRLIDALNTESDQMLLVEQTAPHDLRFRPRRGPSLRAGVAIPNILFCVPVEDEETPAAPRDHHAWVLKSPERVELGVGPFEIEGTLHLPEGSKLEDTLGIIRLRFLALTEAVVRRSDDPGSVQQYPVVVVNGRQVEYVMPAVTVEDGSEAVEPLARHDTDLAYAGISY
jgi:hypothetical protein